MWVFVLVGCVNLGSLEIYSLSCSLKERLNFENDPGHLRWDLLKLLKAARLCLIY